MKIVWACLAMMLGTACRAAQQSPFAFGVLNQRSLQATAAYWNPILNYVSSRSGVPQPLGLSGARGFVAADDHDYRSYRNFFSQPRVSVNE